MEETIKEKIPDHVAIIMDGNGRWAKKRNLPRMAGHRQGMISMKEIIKHSSTIGIKYLTVYAFSTENWKRSKEEVKGIFNLLVSFVDKELRELHKNNVKVNILGDYEKLPKDAKERIEETLFVTENNTGLVFNIALNYGGRRDIVSAFKACLIDVKDGVLKEEDIDEACVKARLSTGRLNIPDPDLVIRTSGEMRLSNFLLWESAYAELVFSESLWPDFTKDDFDKCIMEYEKRQRRFGGRQEQNKV